MKTTLTFEFDDKDENQEFDKGNLEAILKASDGFFVIHDLLERLRRDMKYGELSEEVYSKLEEYRSFIYESLNERGINLDTIIY